MTSTLSATKRLQPAPGEAPMSRFVLGPELARGGMGAVHAATDSVTGDRVAVKVLFENSDEEARGRFLRELNACSALDCRWICRPIAWSVGVGGDKSYLAMEYVDGPTLSALGKRAHKAAQEDPRHAIPATVVTEILRQLLEGLAVAHKASVLHRDLKPANVMITTRGEVKLLDFGIARAATDGTVTKTGNIVGTPAFMSPEQVRGEPLDGRSDLFSLGLTIHALLRGTHRFRELDNTQMLLRAMSEPTAPLMEDVRGIPIALDGILASLTALSPAQRPPDAQGVLAMMAAADLVRKDGEQLLAEYVADHVHSRTVVAQRENVQAAAKHVADGREHQRRAGAEAAALLAFDRAAALDPDGEGASLRDAWALQHDFSIEEPADPTQGIRAAECVADALAHWRDPMRAAVCHRRAADIYLAARCPRRQAISLWRYARERPDDALAIQQLCVLLDGPELVNDTQRRLSTRSIVAGVRTGGKFVPAARPTLDATRGLRPTHVRSSAPVTAAPVVVMGSAAHGVGGSSLAGRVLLGLLVIAAGIVVLRMALDTANVAHKTVASLGTQAEAAGARAEARQESHRIGEAREALAGRNWAQARTVASEVLSASPSIDDAQEARAIRARANLALNDPERARMDLEAYRSRVTRDDDPFLAEANRLLAELRSAPPAGGLR